MFFLHELKHVLALVKLGWSKTAGMKGHITVRGKICGPQREELHCNKRLVCCSNRPNFCCTPNAIFYSRITFKFSVCFFGTENRDFLLEKDTQHTNKITK